MADLRIIDGLIEKELSKVNAKFPNIADSYHAYAVMKRGFDDVNTDIDACKSCLFSYWESVKKDDTKGCEFWSNKMNVFATRLIQNAIFFASLSQRIIDVQRHKNIVEHNTKE